MAIFTAIGTSVATAALGAAAAGTAAFTFIAGLTTAGLQLAAGIAVSLIAKSMQGEPEKQKFGVQGQLQGGEDVPRSINFGWNCTAGSLVYHNTFGNGGVMSARVIAIGDLPIRSLEQVIVDGVPCTLLKGQEHGTYGWPVRQYRVGGVDHLWVKFFDGTQTTAYSHLVNTVSSSDRPYGSDRVGYGVPYVVVYARAPERDDNGNKPLFSGIPSLKFVTYGVKLYNPAKDDTVGGDGDQRYDTPATWGGDAGDFNPIVQLYNVLRGIRYGGQWLYGAQAIAPVRLPAENWITAINQAAGLIAGPDGNEEKFRAGGEVQVGAQVATTVEALLTAANARLVEVGGTYKVYVGAAGEPVMAFTDADILSTEEQTFSPFFSLSDSVNGVDATYPNPAEGWNSKKAPPILRPDLEVLDGNRRLLASVSLDMVPYKGQVQRLMKWALAEALRARRHTFVLGPEFRVLEPGDVVQWSSARNGYEDKLFRVDGIVYKSNLDVIVDLTEVDPSDYDWDQEADYVPVVDGPLTLVGPRPMTMEGWQVFPATLYDNDGIARRPSIEVWFASGVPSVERVRVQVRLDGETDVVFDGEVPYGAPWKVVLGGQFVPATDYEVRGIFVGPPAALWSNQSIVDGEIIEGPWLSVTTPTVPDTIDITVEQLGRELRNVTELVTGDTLGAIQTSLASLRALKEQIALAALSLDNTVSQQINIVEAHNNAAAAAVVESKKALADIDRAMAQLEQQVIAVINDNIASGYLSMTAEVNTEESVADILFRVRAIKDGLLSQAAMLMRASVGTGGQTEAIIAMLADAFYLMTADGEIVGAPFSIVGNEVRINNAMIRNLTAQNINVANIFAQNAAITGVLSVGPGIRIEGPNNRILISD